MSSHGLAGDLRETAIRTPSTSGRAIVFSDGLPPSGAVGYAKGCIWVNTSATKNTERLLVNIRSSTDAEWQYVTLNNR